jgi:NitT/TauT family transport system substrate-binding protein
MEGEMKLATEVTKRQAILSLIAGGLLFAWYGPSAAYAQPAPQTLTPITFALDFILLGRYAPWYTALAKGYYKAAGLDVKIVPSQGTAQSVQALESGIAQFALTDLAGLVTAHAQGTTTAKMIAVAYQKAPYAVFSLASGAGVKGLKQLEGLEIGTGAGSATPQIILGLMREKGLNTSGVKFTNVDGSARVPLLLAGKIPAIETFILAGPAITVAAGANGVDYLLLADHGLDLYSSGIISTNAYLKANPEIAKAFVKASMQGWHDAMANREEAAKLMHEQAPAITEKNILSELRIVEGLSDTPDVDAKGFGTIDPDKFAAGVKFLLKNTDAGKTGKPVSPDDLYSLDYLPNPPVLPEK